MDVYRPASLESVLKTSRLFKKAVQQGRSKRRGEAYSL
jgi:hypothetical protein